MEVMESGYLTCTEAASERGDAEGLDTCWEAWMDTGTHSLIGWDAWWLAVMWAVPAMLAVYAAIWLVVQTVKWVSRGRHTPASATDSD
jgi:uncharacterized membrane protein YhiD involved in acid resistance